ncbi:unnamed protein product [Hermetia illucens]|uniref:Uncharacterized protein n=1 Tax=Hermetia illucens TaxID=343691 RepID=A0A7R8U9L6_HERIL|nr:endocuticle structural glycoprotein ABD-4 [Hermetia illucens]CAD7076718.1 unnamed protein product [Hermetia illucens]
MKVLIVVSALVIACYAQRLQEEQYEKEFQQRNQLKETTTWIPILKYNKEQSQDGSYKTEYETGNNIVHEETGFLKDFSETHPNGVLVQHGQYSYQAPDGQTVNVQYTADENGFHAVGEHIPTPPPIPDEIQKGLDQIYAGIKQQEEESAHRAKSDPEYAKKLEARQQANAKGLYYHEE